MRIRFYESFSHLLSGRSGRNFCNHSASTPGAKMVVGCGGTLDSTLHLTLSIFQGGSLKLFWDLAKYSLMDEILYHPVPQ